MTRHYHFTTSPIGKILLVTEHSAICSLSIGTSQDDLIADLPADWQKEVAHATQPLPAELEHALTHFFATGQRVEQLKLAPKGTAWQQRVWQELQTIPAGQTISYTELAQRSGKPTAVRAAASACGRNPISLFIPCHRVISKSGKLGGYHWGLDVKKQLLTLEKNTN